MQSFSNGKESAYNVGDPGSIPGQENPLEKEQLSTLEFLLGEFHGQRSLAGYSPWGHKEPGKTEWLTLSFHVPKVMRNGYLYLPLNAGDTWE